MYLISYINYDGNNLFPRLKIKANTRIEKYLAEDQI